MRYASLAHIARSLGPDTFNQRAVDAAAPDPSSRWPHCGVEVGHDVIVRGLKTRRDLDGASAVVVGLCFMTKRIVIQLVSGEKMMVLVERLTPLPDSPDHYFEALQAAALEVIQTQSVDCGEVGVSAARIVAVLATNLVTASVAEIHAAVASLVEAGHCYATVDDNHFLAI